MITGPHSRALTTVEADLRKAHVEYERAAQTYREACSEEARCLNKVNQLQKEFDEVVEALKKSGGPRTHWGEARRHTATRI